MGHLKVPGFIKVIPHTLKQTGRYCDGRFDPNHMDFDSFCGLSHTRRSALPLALGMLVYLIAICILFGFLHIYSVTYISFGYIPFTILLLVGMWKEWPFLMLPFIVIKLISVIFIIFIIPILIVIVFKPTSSLFIFFEKLTMSMGTMDGQEAILLLLIISTLSCTMGTFTVWSMYVHFCYIRGCKEMVQQQLDIERNENQAEKWNRSSVENLKPAVDKLKPQKNIS